MVTLDWNGLLFIFIAGMIAGMMALRDWDRLVKWWRSLARTSSKMKSDTPAPELKLVRKPKEKPPEYWDWVSLTDREKEIAEMAAKGKSNGKIAKELSLSPRTVEAHMSSVFKKLRVNSRVAVRDVYRHIVEYEKELQDVDT